MKKTVISCAIAYCIASTQKKSSKIGLWESAPKTFTDYYNRNEPWRDKKRKHGGADEANVVYTRTHDHRRS